MSALTREGAEELLRKQSEEHNKAIDALGDRITGQIRALVERVDQLEGENAVLKKQVKWLMGKADFHEFKTAE